MKRGAFPLVLVLLATAFSCGWCQEEPDGVKIRRLVERAVRLAEQHNAAEIMELASKDLTVRPWGMKLPEFRLFFRSRLRSYGDFTLLYPRPDIYLPEGQGVAGVTLTVLMVRRGEAFPELDELADDPERWLIKASEVAKVFRIILDLSKIDDEWKVTGAHFKRLRDF
jgi:hypothetical protein